jgi:hypothetical protein
LEARLSDDQLSHRQVRAVAKALAQLPTAPTSLAADLETARKVARGLTRAFPDAFRSGTGLASQLEATVSGLSDDVSTAIQYLTDNARYVVPGRCAERLNAKIAEASSRLESTREDTRLVRRANRLGLVYRSIRGANRCEGCFTDNYVEMPNATLFFYDKVGYEYSATDYSLAIRISTGHTQLRVVALHVDGPGYYAVNRATSYAYRDGPSFVDPDTYSVTGTLRVRMMLFSDDGNDMNDCVAGNFNVTFSDPDTFLSFGGDYALSDPLPTGP